MIHVITNGRQYSDRVISFVETDTITEEKLLELHLELSRLSAPGACTLLMCRDATWYKTAPVSVFELFAATSYAYVNEDECRRISKKIADIWPAKAGPVPYEIQNFLE